MYTRCPSLSQSRQKQPQSFRIADTVLFPPFPSSTTVSLTADTSNQSDNSFWFGFHGLGVVVMTSGGVRGVLVVVS